MNKFASLALASGLVLSALSGIAYAAEDTASQIADTNAWIATHPNLGGVASKDQRQAIESLQRQANVALQNGDVANAASNNQLVRRELGIAGVAASVDAASVGSKVAETNAWVVAHPDMGGISSKDQRETIESLQRQANSALQNGDVVSAASYNQLVRHELGIAG
jgi:2-oxo-4-hydroxy-4-carboxy--5-ureidoimidazoline (OHCU) decarboxylase